MVRECCFRRGFAKLNSRKLVHEIATSFLCLDIAFSDKLSISILNRNNADPEMLCECSLRGKLAPRIKMSFLDISSDRLVKLFVEAAGASSVKFISQQV